jgi:hypothetical protein
MDKVWVDPVRRGNPKLVTERFARILVLTGKYRYREPEPEVAEAPKAKAKPKSADGYDEMDYFDLLRMVNDRPDLEPDSRKKEDLIKALRAGGGTYRTRDMQAE